MDLVIKGQNPTPYDISNVVKQLLEAYSDLSPIEFHIELPLLREMQHQIDFILVKNLPNIPHYKMNLKDN